jgi:hypothetical protein
VHLHNALTGILDSLPESSLPADPATDAATEGRP